MQVYAPDGTMAGSYAPNESTGNNASAEDSNGNYITGPPVYGTDPVDTLGRDVVNGASCSVGTCSLFVPNSQGGTSLYTVTPANINVKTNFGQSGVTEYSGSMAVVQSITLPDGNSYTFKYDCDSAPGPRADHRQVKARTTVFS